MTRTAASSCNVDPQLAGYQAGQLTALYQRIHDAMLGIPGVSSVAVCGYSPQSGDSWNDSAWVDGRRPGTQGRSLVELRSRHAGIFRRDRESDHSKDAKSPSGTRRLRSTWQSSMKRLPESSSRIEDPIGKHFGRSEIGASRQYEIVGVAKDARYLTYGLDRPIGPFFFLPEAQHDVFPNAENTKGDVRSHYLHDVVVEMQPGPPCPTRQCGRPCCSGSESAGNPGSQLARSSGGPIQPAAADRTTHILLWSSFAGLGFDRTVRSHRLQRRTPRQ